MQTGFPRPHLALIALLSLGLSSLVMAKFAEDPEAARFHSDDVLASVIEMETTPDPSTPEGMTTTRTTVPLNERRTPAAAAAYTDLAVATPSEPVINVTQDVTQRNATVRPGDNLATIFKRQGIPYRELQVLLDTAGPLASRLPEIYPGQQLTFSVTGDNMLTELVYQPARLERLRFAREGDVFTGSEEVDEPTRVQSYKRATIDHSLFIASQRAGLSDELTMRLAQIFQWDVDFVLDIRKGDSFHVLFEELYLGDEKIGNGNILAAEFINQGQVYRATRYQGNDGRADFYDPNGHSMRKAFLRAPVSFSRISSNFNLRRIHPLHNKRMPHRGIDYAAPTGTPVMAAGDGRVKIASRTKPNGNYVVIQHGEQFTTKYLHLSKFGRGIRSGSKVEQGQIIGYVGATGQVTGAHLHYEFLVNGAHMNPRTVPLPNAEPIAPEEADRFRDQTLPLLAALDSHKDASAQLAQIVARP